MRPRRRAQALVCALSATASLAARADDSGFQPITPYRPSVSTPAQLPYPGQLEFELGGLAANDGESRRNTLPYLLKLAFNQDWGLLIGGDGYVWTGGEVGRFNGVGDTSITLKRAWIVNSANAFGMELTAKIPTAKETIGTGRADYEVNTIYSADFGPVHMDANLNATQLGFVDPGSSRTQFGGASAFTVSLSERWAILGELSGTHQAGADNGVQLLTALTFSPSKILTFDFGVARAFRPRPAANLLSIGVVLPLARLW